MPNVHDPLFRWAFSDPRRVGSLLRAILPPALVALIDCHAIASVPVELVDKDLSEKRPDAVWRLPLHDRSFDLTLILEHQSQDLRRMGLRLLDYARGFWMWWSDQHRRAPFLPPIVGLVISHDPHGWHSPTRLRDLCQTDPELEALLGANQPNVEFFLEDLHFRKDQDILGWEMDAVGKLTLLLLKHAKGSRPALGDCLLRDLS